MNKFITCVTFGINKLIAFVKLGKEITKQAKPILDTNKDGKLTVKEVVDGLDQLDIKVTKKKITK